MFLRINITLHGGFAIVQANYILTTGMASQPFAYFEVLGY